MILDQHAFRLSRIHAGIAASVLLHALVLAWTPSLLRDAGRRLPALLEVRLASEPSTPVATPIPRQVRDATREAPMAPATSRVMDAAPTSLPSVAPAAPVPEPVVAAPAAVASAAQAITPPDLRAAYLANPRPPYPLAARRLGLEGKVVLRVEILESGSVAQVLVARGSGHDMLDQSALQAVKQWRFVPARKGGEAVSASVEVPISFRLEERDREAGYI